MRFLHTKVSKLSTVGFGTFQSADPAVIAAALESGVNWFVTAEAYGDSNQKSLGDSLAKILDKVFIFTKVGINFNSQEEPFTQPREQIRNSVEHCIKLIGKKPLDFVGLHRLDVSEDEKNIPRWEGALDELINLQEEGYIKFVGLSEPTTGQIERAVQIAEARKTKIAAIESAYSIATRRAEINGVKDICEKHNILFIAYSTIMHGLTDIRLQKIASEDFYLSNEQFQKKVFELLGITGDFIRENVDMFSLENVKHNVTKMIEFQHQATACQLNPTQLALAWAQHKGVFPIPGSRNPVHIIENNASAGFVDSLAKTAVFDELDKLFPVNTFRGDPNPIAIAGVLDANSIELNQAKPKLKPVNSHSDFFKHKQNSLVAADEQLPAIKYYSALRAGIPY